MQTASPTSLRRCPLCRSQHATTLFAEAKIDRHQLNQFAYASRKLPEYMHYRLLLCRACDLVYADALLEESRLQTAYAEAAFDSGVEASYAARTYIRLLRPAIAKLADRRGAVDIGTGDGAFLRELLAEGFLDVAGVEPSQAPIAAAPPEIRACIRSGFFRRGLFPENSCSLVTCFQTIEHVADPVELCAAAAELLKPGGILCLIGHNRRAFSAKVLGRSSPIFDIEHLQLFSRRSLRPLLKQSGLRDIQIHSFWNCYPVSYWLRMFPFPDRWKTSLMNSLSALRIDQTPMSLPAGNLVAWGVK